MSWVFNELFAIATSVPGDNKHTYNIQIKRVQRSSYNHTQLTINAHTHSLTSMFASIVAICEVEILFYCKFLTN